VKKRGRKKNQWEFLNVVSIQRERRTKSQKQRRGEWNNTKKELSHSKEARRNAKQGLKEKLK